jgi:AcrR family transcriptional regulator
MPDTRWAEHERAPAAQAPLPLPQRKRQLVRQEIARAAWLLFAERGYEDTTVDEIARSAGISRRSFFRYFSSKEDVVVGTSDALAEEVLAAFAARPRSEPPLVAIQRALTPAIESRLADEAESRAIISLLRQSRTLRRALLERHARLEERLAALVAARTGADRRRDPTPALLAFLARALMDTAFNVWYDQRPPDVAAMIDDLFRRLRVVVGGQRRRTATHRRAQK